jgi:hypothetical protein
MLVSDFIKKANAQGMSMEHLSFTVLTKLDDHQKELYLAGKCICCQETESRAEAIWDMDCDEEGRVFGTCVAYAQELFCDGCVDNMPAEALLEYGLISQTKFDLLCTADDYFMADDKSDEYVTAYTPDAPLDRLRDLWLTEYPDASMPFDEWRKKEAKKRETYDDDLPF